MDIITEAVVSTNYHVCQKIKFPATPPLAGEIAGVVYFVGLQQIHLRF